MVLISINNILCSCARFCQLLTRDALTADAETRRNYSRGVMYDTLQAAGCPPSVLDDLIATYSNVDDNPVSLPCTYRPDERR